MKIQIIPGAGCFLVTRQPDGLILFEHRRYADALAAAHILGREHGLSVEPQPDLEGGQR